MVEVRVLKKSLDKPKKEDYKESKWLKPYSLDYQKGILPPKFKTASSMESATIVTRKEIIEAIRILDGLRRKLRKVIR